MWAGLVRTEPHMVSGWHHHGDHETSIYVISGALRMESGPEGESVVEAGAGDFLYVPQGAIHRETNPGDDREPDRRGEGRSRPPSHQRGRAVADDQPALISSSVGQGSMR